MQFPPLLGSVILKAQQLLPDGQLPIGANTAKGHGKGTGKGTSCIHLLGLFRAHCPPMKFVLRCLVLEIARGTGPRKRGGRNRNRGNQKSLDEEQIPMSFPACKLQIVHASYSLVEAQHKFRVLPHSLIWLAFLQDEADYLQ